MKTKTNGGCPPGKIRNPATHKCVNISGKVGRQVVLAASTKNHVAMTAVVSKVSKVVSKKKAKAKAKAKAEARAGCRHLLLRLRVGKDGLREPAFSAR